MQTIIIVLGAFGGVLLIGAVLLGLFYYRKRILKLKQIHDETGQ